ncbi:beta strand repeat-containing protein, partial [Microbulbifer sp. SA54]|uniref:beta strand repeat-containing protein n=1 Tax=Microbulbifer sp. SA54 TaxID=3401577 RepID=UPI003AAF074E
MFHRKKPISAAIKLAHMACFGSVFSLASVAQASPGTANVNTGTVDITTTTSDDGSGSYTSTEVAISTNFADISWESFDLDAQDTANFEFTTLPDGTTGLVVNHVAGNASNIQGTITSNGHVVLLNPRGVFFSEGSSVNVAALTVSTLEGGLTSVDDKGVDFSLNQNGDIGEIVNAGSIVAESGNVTLIGQSVRNIATGNIEAQFGEIRMLAGNSAVLSFDAGSLIGVEVTNEVLSKEFESGSDEVNAILNDGSLKAASVVLEASVADKLFTNAVNNSGGIQATGIQQVGGTIRLTGNVAPVGGQGDETIAAINTGSLDTSGVIAGSVQITGRDITQSGQISADALADASGGEVTLRAERRLSLSGSISAKGAGAGNTGGTVITAAGEVFEYVDDTADGNAVVVTRSDSGAASGSWTLEADRLEVADCGDNCISGADLSRALEDNAAVTVETTGVPGSDPGDNSGNIAITDAVQWSSGAALQLESTGSIQIASTGQGTPTIDAGAAAVQVTAGHDFQNDGAINAGDFALSVGAAGTGSASKLGAVTATGSVTVAGGSGTDALDLDGFTASSTLFVEAAASDLTVSVETAGNEVAALSGFEAISVAASDTLDVGLLESELAVGGTNNVTVQAGGASIAFDAVTLVTGDGDDTVTGLGDWTLAETGGASNSGIRFTGNLLVETVQGTLNGTGQVDNFVVNGANSVIVSGLTFSGLSTINGVGGNDTLDSSGMAVSLGATDYAVQSAGIDFSNIHSVTAATLNAHSGGTRFTLNGDNSITAESIEFSGVSLVNGAAGDDRLDALSLGDASLFFRNGDGSDLATQSSGGIRFIGMDNVLANRLDLTLVDASVEISGNNSIQAGAGNAAVSFASVDDVIGDNGDVVTGLGNWSLLEAGGAASNLINFSGNLLVLAGQASLRGTAGNDSFTLNADGSLAAGGLVFTDLAAVDASGEQNGRNGRDVLLASDYVAGVALGAGNNSVSAAGIAFSDIEAVTTSTLNAHVAGSDFSLDGNTITARSVEFTGVDLVNGSAGTDSVSGGTVWEVIGQDVVNGDDANQLITFSGIESFNTDNGVLEALNLGDDFLFIISPDARRVAVGNVNGPEFLGLNEVVASNLDFSQIDVNLRVTGSNAIDAGSATFSGVEQARGDGDNTVTGLGNWTLLGGGGASNSNIDFSGPLNVDASGVTLLGTTGVDNFVLAAANEVQAGGLTFSGL